MILRPTRRELLLAGLSCLAAGRRLAAADCDVCIVGSGFAGTYLGLRLAAHGLRVTIVEAGEHLAPTAAATGATDLFPTVSRGDYALPIDETRTIACGGTSRRWNGVITRLRPQDFRARSRHGIDVDWPIAYEDLSPYYDEAERLLDVQGARMVAGAEPPRGAYPIEWPAGPSPAAAFRPRNLALFPLAFALRPDGRPIRLDEGPLDRFAAAPGATLLTGQPATELVADERGTITAVRLRQGHATLRARHVVVAAGVFETARLLLASTSRRFPRGLGNDRGLVGAHFNAHPRYRTAIAPRQGLGRVPRIHRTFTPGDAARARGANAFHADVHLGDDQPLVDVTLDLEPAAANRVALAADQRDRWGRPVLTLDANWTSRDRRTRELALTSAGDLAGALGTPAGTPPALRWFHPAGVCRMAASPRHGVVDADGRVFGTTNLYVAGASVFATSGSTNPTLTVVALALRLGDHLARARPARGR